MPDLIAQGPQQENRWRRGLPGPETQESIVVGRTADPWSVPWDDRISREHVRISMCPEGACVERLAGARNPIFFRGERRDEFTLKPGEHFVIGRTTFTLANRPSAAESSTPAGLTEHAFATGQLRKTAFRDAARRIDVLARLPDLIVGSDNDQELLIRVTSVLMQGIPDAAIVAVVAAHQKDSGVDVLQYDDRLPTTETPRPSGRLIKQAVSSRQSVLHIWSGSQPQRSGVMFTESEGTDWAFCVPVPCDTCQGWALYVAGSLASLGKPVGNEEAATVLQDDLKFTEVVATSLGNLRQVRFLQRRQSSLKQFFAPVVLQALGDRSTDEVLDPREAEVSVLFCDLRGFSRRSEEEADDLLGLLEGVSQALGVMTHHILDTGGVVGDFHGDAAMGFWGWPIANPDSPGQAARAALNIQQSFERVSANAADRLARFRCGIGIATGRAVAGRIGTVDQVKVSAFGPVVNLASRLEGMTKQLRAGILLDEPTANYVREHVDPSVARVRRLAHVRPAGVRAPLTVSQLLPPYGAECPLDDSHIAAYEAALDALRDGDWGDAFERLHEVPASDRAKDFLTVFIASHGRNPPPGWNGIIDLPTK